MGVLANLSTALAASGVSLLAQSTFDTDYLLVRSHDLARATAALAFRVSPAYVLVMDTAMPTR